VNPEGAPTVARQALHSFWQLRERVGLRDELRHAVKEPAAKPAPADKLQLNQIILAFSEILTITRTWVEYPRPCSSRTDESNPHAVFSRSMISRWRFRYEAYVGRH
jgi:hypothetical protein